MTVIPGDPTSMMPDLISEAKRRSLPFILYDDPITPKMVGVKGVAYLIGEIGC